MSDLIKALRGELSKNCVCHAYSSGECSCNLVWPEDVASEAADYIAKLESQQAEAVAAETERCINRISALDANDTAQPYCDPGYYAGHADAIHESINVIRKGAEA